MAPPTDDIGLTDTVPSAGPSGSPAVTRKLGRYDIETVLGVGGMGVVYAAFDPELERRVALKVLPDAKHGAPARERLLREARAMARVTHPNVVRVYEVDSVDGHDFVAMELVEGSNLARWLRAEQRTPEAIVDVFLAAGRGLVAAHAAGVVHRDFKPGNVLCATDGRILVTDFGLARSAEPSDGAGEPASTPPGRATPLSDITETGMVLGTPAYMAPEQRGGLPVGPAADQFSFCVALWEGLTGKRPYSGSVEEMCAALDRGSLGLDPTPLPRRLRAPLLRGLEIDAAKRWPSMTALLAQVAPATRRRIGPFPLGGVAVLAFALAVGLGALAFWQRARKPEWIADVRAMPQFAENANAPAVSPDGHWILYVALRDGATSANIFATGPDGNDPRPVLPSGLEPRSVRWSSDGTWFVYHTRGGDMFRQHLIDRDPRQLGPREDLGHGRFPDACGDRIVYIDEDTLVLQDRGTRRELFTARDDMFVSEPRCDRSGRRVVFGHGPRDMTFAGGDIMMVDLEHGDSVSTLVADQRSLFPSFTPDGRAIVFTRRGPDERLNLYELRLENTTVHRLTSGTDNEATEIAAEVTPDGQRIIFNRDTSKRQLYVNRVTGDRVERTAVTSRLEMLAYPTPLITGAVLVVRRDLEDKIVLVTPDGAEREIAPGALPIASTDGKRALFVAVPDRTALVAVDLSTNARTELAKLPGPIQAGIETADGIHLAIDRGNGWEAWRVVAGAAEPEGRPGLIVPSPDGRSRAIVTTSGTSYQLIVEGADRAIEIGPTIIDAPRVTWLDGHRLAYYAANAFHIVSSTREEVVIEAPTTDPRLREEQILAPDGSHWYDTALSGKVSRHVLVNYGDRPWK